MRNGSLWSNLVSKKYVNSHSKRLQLKHFIFHILKAYKVVQKARFSFIILLQLRLPIEHTFSHNVCHFMHELLCWDTPSKYTGLWQLPNVSSAFKELVFAVWLGLLLCFCFFFVFPCWSRRTFLCYVYWILFSRKITVVIVALKNF